MIFFARSNYYHYRQQLIIARCKDCLYEHKEFHYSLQLN